MSYLNRRFAQTTFCAPVILAMLFLSFGLSISIDPVTAASEAALPTGTKSIYLVDADGKEHAIGSVTFGSKSPVASIDVVIDESSFVEKFLSMRPFRCIDGRKQTICYLPYPYDLRDVVTAGDLSDLEYRLLFLHKGPTEYGIDAWNGLYYKLDVAADGSLNGALYEADFNVLAAPPEEAFARPLQPHDLTPSEEGRHRFPQLSIR